MCDPHGKATYDHIEDDSHATYSQAKYRYITHVHIQAMTIKMNGDRDSMLEDDQDNIQVSESTHQVKRYTIENLYM